MYKTELLPYWHRAENVPEKECTVLIYYTDQYGSHYAVATWTSDNEWWFPGSHNKEFEVIAWQSLPNKPIFKERTIS